jgi:hypothetical protein
MIASINITIFVILPATISSAILSFLRWNLHHNPLLYYLTLSIIISSISFTNSAMISPTTVFFTKTSYSITSSLS